MKIFKIFSFLVFLSFLYANQTTINNTTFFLQNPPPKIKYFSEMEYINITVHEVNFGQRLRAFYSCKNNDKNEDCYKYIRNRYFDFTINEK